MDIDNDGVAAEETSNQVQVRFVTKLNPPYKVPQSSISIPANLNRHGLSILVNNLLEAGNEEWKPEPFDFLINSELLRKTLEAFLLDKDISTEKVLEIEYIKTIVPRKGESSLHDDWVSAVDGSNPRYILTGCYDTFGRVWTASGACTHILDGHSGPITSVCSIKKNAETKTNQMVATASKDMTLRLWKFDLDDTVDPPRKIVASKILRGHTAAVQSVVADPSGEMVCSSSWDCSIRLWYTNILETDAGLVSLKRRKNEDNDEGTQYECEALTTFVGHTQCVSAVAWPQKGTVYSGSWDYSIRIWDVDTGKDSSNIFSGKVINSLDIGGEGSALIAAGCSDPVVRVWDPRKPGTLSSIFQLSSSKNTNSWISSCKWHPKSWLHLIAASHDGKVRLWDLRSTYPVAELASHNDKALCADWWGDDIVISGGADSKLSRVNGVSVQ